VTERLYYTDPYLTDFDARVIEVRDAGGRSGFVLDRTAFYPTSGGQPFDTGTLGGARVVDVVDDDHGVVVHVVEGVVETSGLEARDSGLGFVSGRINWSRRFDHMQQHTGQHVLSAAIDRVCSVRTESFHLGADAATIDLARELSAAEIAASEDAANEVVWADRPVATKFVDAADAVSLNLRKEPVRTGTLRLVDIDGFDVSACGGTHVRRTGAIGVVAISGWERFRGGTRLEFKCGGRALQAYRALRDTVRDSTALLSIAAGELPQAIERLQGEGKELRRRLKEVGARLAVFEAEALAEKAETVAGVRLIVEALAADAGTLKTMAQTLASSPGRVAVLVTSASPVSIVVSRAADVSAVDAAGVLKAILGRFGGKGGGRPEMAQGGGIDAPAETVVAAARALLRPDAADPSGSPTIQR
jgi:alanyl-tRNA synthetase